MRDTAFPVKDINIEIHDLIEDMAELMYRHEGIGLAAPQVGILQQIIIADDDGIRLSLINSAIVEEEGEDFWKKVV